MARTVTRSRMLMISLPMLLAAGLLISAGGLMVAGYIGRPAAGERVTVQVRSGCAGQWGERLQARADAIGLGDPVMQVLGDTVQLTVTLPGNADDREAVPALLTAPGLLRLHTQDGVDVADGSDLVETRMSMSYMARATLVLRPSEVAWARIRALDPDAVLVVTLDGVSVELGEIRRIGRDDELHVQPALEDASDEVHMVADWSIVLGSGPGPCGVSGVTVVEPVEG